MSAPPEIWLKTNRRALVATLLVVLLLGAAAVAALVHAPRTPYATELRLVGGLALAICAYLSLSVAYQMTLPRLAYADEELWVYLASAEPIKVPIEIVELFFAGQGRSHLPAADDAPSKARTVVIRLSEAARDWHFRDVKPAWGEWREGYIIVRGTWCEPLTPEVMKRLNRRLREVHRERESATREAAE
jgi:hypothetical protein